LFRLIRTIKALAKDNRVPKVIRALLVIASFGWLIPGPVDEIIGVLALLALLCIRPGIVSEHWHAAYRVPRLTSADRKHAALAFAPLAVLAVIVAALAFAPSVHADAKRAPHAPRAVGLFDATQPPTDMVYLYPGARVTLADTRGYDCARHTYFTDVSAYTWRGGSLLPQRWDKRADVDYLRRTTHFP
jgi:hypothetical protein